MAPNWTQLDGGGQVVQSPRRLLSSQLHIETSSPGSYALFIFKLHASQNRTMERQPCADVFNCYFLRKHHDSNRFGFSLWKRDETHFVKSWIVVLFLVKTIQTLFKQGKGRKDHLKCLPSRQSKDVVELCRSETKLFLDDIPAELNRSISKSSWGLKRTAFLREPAEAMSWKWSKKASKTKSKGQCNHPGMIPEKRGGVNHFSLFRSLY